MKNLVIFGQSHDVNKEIELFDESEFGMDVAICRKDNGIEVRRNCTEFHHRFESDLNFGVEDTSSAFESNHHATGGTIKVKDIEWITIEPAFKMHDSHR